MYPNLFTLGPITLHSYGLLVALGLGLAIFLAHRRAPAEGVDPEQLLDLTFWMVAGGLVGARLLYVAVTWRDFAHDWFGIVRIWDGGLVFYGAFVGAIVALLLYCRRRKLSAIKILDLCAPYIPLAHAFGRIGCFLAGCCYGAACESWVGVDFPILGDHVRRLPTQLFESGLNLLLFFALLRLRAFRSLKSGQLFWSYVASYALGRFILEFFRGDEIRGAYLLPWMHTSQLIALAALLTALTMLAISIFEKKVRIP